MRRQIGAQLAAALITLLGAALCGCTCDDEEAEKVVKLDDDPLLRLDARVVLMEHCGDCHMRDSPKSSADALKAIDFTTVTWAAGVGALDRQRIIDNLAANLPAGGHHGTSFRVPPGQFMVVRDYLASLNGDKQHHVEGRSQATEEKAR